MYLEVGSEVGGAESESMNMYGEGGEVFMWYHLIRCQLHSKHLIVFLSNATNARCHKLAWSKEEIW